MRKPIILSIHLKENLFLKQRPIIILPIHKSYHILDYNNRNQLLIIVSTYKMHWLLKIRSLLFGAHSGGHNKFWLYFFNPIGDFPVYSNTSAGYVRRPSSFDYICRNVISTKSSIYGAAIFKDLIFNNLWFFFFEFFNEIIKWK